jgi:glutamyl/glutaminyl-tRNA synthetase
LTERRARALVGLSEGGYGALNIGLHHPGEFHVLESWSGYVVADDIADGVTEVARGADLADQSAVQAVLWRALGADPPAWLHAPLILGGDGKKLSKSHHAAAVGDLRELGWSAADVWRVVLPWLGLTPPTTATDGRAVLQHALAAFDAARIPRGPFTWMLDPTS